MAKQPSPTGGGEPFQIRPGPAPMGPSSWKGVNSESDPGSHDPGDLIIGRDIRFEGRNIVTRPGLIVVGQVGDGGQSIIGISEEPAANPRIRIWMTTIGCFGVGLGLGCQLSHYDCTEDPGFQVYGNFPAEVDRRVQLMKYGDKLYMGEATALRQVLTSTNPTGVDISFVPAPPQNPTLIFPGETIMCGLEFEGRLYVGLQNDAAPTTTSRTIVYNGSSWDVALAGTGVPMAMGIWRNKLVVGYDAAAGHVRVREPGTTETWNTVALGGFSCAGFGNAMQEVREHLYIASGSTGLYRFDGTALSLVRTIATADNVDGRGVCALTLHDGLLHYAWNEIDPFPAHLGRHDPDSTANEYVDDYKDLTADQSEFTSVNSVLSYRNQIYLGGGNVWVVATEPNDVQGDLEVINDNGPTSPNFPMVHMMRFP